MASGTFYPAASGDDGYWRTSEFDTTSAHAIMGNIAAQATNVWVRFANVTIPQGSTITSAYVKWTAESNKTGTVVNVRIYANDVDNPTAPTDQTEANALDLTSASVDWDNVASWTGSTQYNSPSIVTVIQEIINRVGWSSGQALMCLFKDNGSDSGEYRSGTQIDYDSGSAKAELHVEWTVGVNVTAVCCSLTLTTHTATISYDINVQAVVSALTLTENVANVGFGVAVNTVSVPLLLTTHSASVSYDLNVSCVSVSLTLSEKVATISYDINVKAITDTFTLTTHSAEVWDGAEWALWIAANIRKLTKLYYFVLTGSADGTTDATIPISSWQARRKSGEPTFLSVVIPGTSYQASVSARLNGEMQVYMAYIVDGVEAYREIICRADYETMRIDEGGRNQSITLQGHKTETFTPKTIDLQDVVYLSNDQGMYRYRCAAPDMFLNPGDTAKYEGVSITVGQITNFVGIEGGTLTQSMDVSESEI